MLMLPWYRNQSIEGPQADQLTGFYMEATLAFNGLKLKVGAGYLQKVFANIQKLNYCLVFGKISNAE